MRFNKCKAKIKQLLSMHNSSVKSGHLENLDLELNKHNFPTNPMGSSSTLCDRLYFS